MGKLSDLVLYFSKIAESHIDIQHTEKKCHFTKRTFEDILLDMKGENIYYPLLNLEPYDFEFTEPFSDNLHKNRNIAFSIIDSVDDKTNADKKYQSWEKCEEIGDEILIKILTDKKKRLPILSDFNINDVKGIPFENKVDGLTGIRYEVTLSNTLNNEINKEKWLL